VVDNAVFSLSILLSRFWKYLRSNFEAVRNRAELWTFLPSKIVGAPAPKSCTHIHMPAPRHVTGRVWGVIFLGPKVITANTLNFKPIFELSSLEIVKDFRPR